MGVRDATENEPFCYSNVPAVLQRNAYKEP